MRVYSEFFQPTDFDIRYKSESSTNILPPLSTIDLMASFWIFEFRFKEISSASISLVAQHTSKPALQLNNILSVLNPTLTCVKNKCAQKSGGAQTQVCGAETEARADQAPENERISRKNE